MTEPKPERVSIPELYARMEEMMVAVGEPIDIEAGLADVWRRIEEEISGLADEAWAALPKLQQQSHDSSDWIDGWIAGYKARRS